MFDDRSLCDVWSITQSFREPSAIFKPKFLLFSSVDVLSVTTTAKEHE